MDSPDLEKTDLLTKFKIPLALTLVGTVLLIGGIFKSDILGKTFSKSTTKPSLTTTSYTPTTIKVDVEGAVKNPGVYSLNLDARVEEAIIAAGGISSEADKDNISKNIILSQKLSDGMKVYIPKVGESHQSSISASGGNSQAGAVAGTGVISINNASAQDLDSLPGVGAVTSQKIIDHRPYVDISDLINKKVVTRSVFEKIKEKISI